MKIEFIKEDKKDNRVPFKDLKVGDVFTIADPKIAKSTVYMKVKIGKNYTASGVDTINLETGEVSAYSDTMKEVISIDQAFVYKQNAIIDILLD